MIYVIGFGDSTFTSKITAVLPNSNILIHEQIKKSLLTLYYDKSYNSNPFATAVFQIDDSKTNFKFFSVSGFSYKYTPNGKSINYDNEPYVSILQIPAEQNETIKEFADGWLSSLTSLILTEEKT